MNISTDIPLTAFSAGLLLKMDAVSARTYLGVVNDKRFVHSQGVESSSWVINHGLNYNYPTVRVFDGVNEIFGDVTYTDENNLTINFLGPISGTATIN
jgi:hypothetical protein